MSFSGHPCFWTQFTVSSIWKSRKYSTAITISVQASAEPFNQKCVQTKSAFISDKNHKILHLSDRWLKWSYQGSAWGSQLWGCACRPPCFPLTSFMLVSVVDCGRWHLVQALTAGAFWERWTKIQSSLGISWRMLNPSRGPDLNSIEYRNVLFVIWWLKSNNYAHCVWLQMQPVAERVGAQTKCIISWCQVKMWWLREQLPSKLQLHIISFTCRQETGRKSHKTQV